jgi:hypothetical protein
MLYLPETERWSHYFHADIARQFDDVVHINTTHALPPQDPTPPGRAGGITICWIPTRRASDPVASQPLQSLKPSPF